MLADMLLVVRVELVGILVVLPVVVAGKDDQLGDDQTEEDMRPVVALADRLELVPVLVMVLLVFPMMLFLCYGQYKILFHLEFSFPPNQVVVVRQLMELQLMGLQQLLWRLHELFVQQLACSAASCCCRISSSFSAWIFDSSIALSKFFCSSSSSAFCLLAFSAATRFWCSSFFFCASSSACFRCSSASASALASSSAAAFLASFLSFFICLLPTSAPTPAPIAVPIPGTIDPTAAPAAAPAAPFFSTGMFSEYIYGLCSDA